jgi:hypothetical protein
MANTARKSRVKCITGNRSLADVKAGSIILPAFSGQYIIVGGWLRALGGNAGGATTVNISDTTGTPVVGVACTCATGLAENRVCDFDDATYSTRTTYGVAFAAGKALQILDAGASALDTCSSVDFCVKYTMVSTA